MTRDEIDLLITERILMFYEGLLEREQIAPIKPGTVMGDAVSFDPNAPRPKHSYLRVVEANNDED